jgi:RNA polymerase sigma-70 factor (ECF subfamily)
VPRVSFYDDVWINQIAYKKAIEESGETNVQFLHRLRKLIPKVIKDDLTPKQKEILILYYYEKLNIPQIASLKSLNKSTISRHIKGGKRKIKQLLKYVLELQ